MAATNLELRIRFKKQLHVRNMHLSISKKDQAKQEVKTVKAVASLGNKLEQLRQRVAGLVGKMAASSLAVRALLEDEPVDSWRARFGTSELERVEIVAIAESIQKTTGNKIEALDEDLKSVLSYQRTVYTLGMGHNIPTKET